MLITFPETVAPSPPPADRVVDAGDVERLRQRLELEPGIDLSEIAWAPEPLLVGEGWDNTVWDIGSHLDGTPLALRVARRASAERLLAHEAIVLRHLLGRAEQLAMRIPRVYGTADVAVLTSWIPGHDVTSSTDDELACIGGRLAETLGDLHGIAPRSLAGANPVRGCPLDSRLPLFDELTRRIELSAGERARTREVWEAGLRATPWRGPALLLHGDPHPANVVIPDDGGSTVLIDFGDTTAGDPASDLGALGLYGDHDHLLEQYLERADWPCSQDPAVRAALRLRARAWSVLYALSLLTAYEPERGLGRRARMLLDRL